MLLAPAQVMAQAVLQRGEFREEAVDVRFGPPTHPASAGDFQVVIHGEIREDTPTLINVA
jgi:hypothetical protein